MSLSNFKKNPIDFLQTRQGTFLRLSLALMASLMLTTSPAQAVSDFYNSSEIQFYGGSCDNPQSDSGGGETTKGASGAETAFNFFIGEPGLSKQGAAGIVGNLMRETGGDTFEIDPTLTPGDSGYYGVAQWDSGRWSKLEDFAGSRSTTNLQVQLGYMWKEMHEDSYKSVIPKLKNADDPKQAAKDFNSIYERGSDEDKRASDAQTAYNKFKDNDVDQTAIEPSDSSSGGSDTTCCSSPSSSQPINNERLNINDIVKKYDLQSVMVRELGGGTVAAYKANSPPTTPASTMKLVIADTLLRSKLNLANTVNVTSDVYYDGTNDLGVSRITLSDALEAMLSHSSNVGANVIMKALGGVDGFTNKAHTAGYPHTIVRGYYDPSNDGKNTSTISDEVTAMNHIFSANKPGYKIAQNALEGAAKNDNHYNVVDDANKWAGTSDVAGNVGKFKVGNKDYIIGLYINKSMSDQSAVDGVKNGSADLAEAAKTGASSDASSALCCSSPDAGNSVQGGKGAESGSWNSGLQPPYILEQWAIETLKDLAAKKGVPQANAVTKEHVVALVAFAIGEGGDIQNGDLFNPLNTGIDAPELIDGPHSVDGVQAFKSFDAGVEGAARTFAKPQYSRLASALLSPNSNAKQFMYALSYNWKYPGGVIWAGASTDEPAYYNGRLDLVQQVRGDYKSYAALVIGTSAHEQAENIQEPSKLQFADGGSGLTDDSCAGTSSESIVQWALDLSWPDDSHGTTPKPAYQRAYNQFNSGGAGVADCGSFVGTVMHASGADKNYPASGTMAQEQYVRSHPDKYEVADKVTSKGDLQPGDILIVNQGSGEGAAGHTYIFVGKQSPHNYDTASASLNSRAANLGFSELHDSRGDYLRARLK